MSYLLEIPPSSRAVYYFVGAAALVVGTGYAFGGHGSARRLDARCVFLAALSSVLVAVLTPNTMPVRLAAESLLVAGLLAWVRPPLRWLASRLLLLLPFLFLASLPLVYQSLGRESYGPVLMIIVRAGISFGALAAAFRACGADGILAALGRLHLPPILVTTTTLMLRYLSTLEGETTRMMRARDSRGAPLSVRARASVAGSMVGSMFVRSFERSERVSSAMQARGFQGVLPSPVPVRMSTRDILFLAGLLAMQLSILNLR